MTGIDSNLNSNVPLRRLALRCGRVFDGSGADPVEDAVVVVEGERIAAVGPESQVSIDPADEMIDLRPCTLLPGLIDAHVHLWGRSPGDAMPWASGPIEYRALRSANEARKLLEAGFTAVRDLGSQTSVVVKRAIDDGVALGPRMKAAGMAIARTGGPWFGIDPSWRWARPAEGIDECRRAVHLSIREGSSVIKIGTSTSHEPGGAWGEVPTYTVGEIEAMTTEAHKWGLRVAAHAMGTPGVRNAVMGGVDTVEHAYNIDEDTLGLIVEKGVFVVPTLRLTHVNPSPWAQQTYRDQIGSLRRAHEAGAKIALGSDTGEERTPHGSGNAIEFELMSEVMEPRDSLVAGMLTAAQAMGLENEIGTIETGKYADMVAVRDNPLVDVSALQKVEFVMQGGRAVVTP